MTLGLYNQPSQYTNKQQVYISTKIANLKPTIVFKTYWNFAAERQSIFFRRLEGQGAPWTDDPIFQRHKFTNAYRASDRVSQYLISEVIQKGDQSPNELFFRILLFKIFNKIETWELLVKRLGEIRWDSYSHKTFDDCLTRASAAGAAIYSAAYIMPSGTGALASDRKHRTHLQLLEMMMQDQLAERLADAKSLKEVFTRLRSYPTIGDFLAFQYAIDLNYSNLIDFPEMEFVIAGPGAKDGIAKCFRETGGLDYSEIIRATCESQTIFLNQVDRPFRSLFGRDLQLIDCQNLFCEVDKYARIKHPDIAGLSGRTRIKQVFKPKSSAIRLTYPSKWKIDVHSSLT